MEIMIRTIILAIGWPILIAGSIYLFIQGNKAYTLVKGSLVGRVTQTLVVTMLVGMYSLGIVASVLMFCNVKIGAWVVLPVFLAWFVSFVWTLKVLKQAQEETAKLTEGQK